MGNYATQPDFATTASAITPSDTMDTTTFLDGSALYVGTGGNVRVIMRSVGANLGNTVTFTNVADGTFLPIIVDYVIATDTTASGIIAVK